MKVVLIKRTEKLSQRLNNERLGLFLKVNDDAGSGSSSEPSQRQRRGDEEFHEEIRGKILSNVLHSPSVFIVGLKLTKGRDGQNTLTTKVYPFGDHIGWHNPNWIEEQSRRYPEVRLSVFLKIAGGIDEGDGEIRDFVSVERMHINRLYDLADWFCDRISPTDKDSFPWNVVMHLEIVAEFSVNSLFEFDHEALTKNKWIAEEGSSDVKIISRNGTEIRAHKSVLSECSPVLEAMFESGMKESVSGRLDMSELSEKGLMAFMQYAYSRDLTMAREKIEIAFELMRFGHKYDIHGLEVRTLEYLMEERRNEYFSVQLAFEVYMFTRNVDFEIELKEKVIGILKGKMEELKSLPEYKNIFEESPESIIATELEKEFGMPDSDSSQ